MTSSIPRCRIDLRRAALLGVMLLIACAPHQPIAAQAEVVVGVYGSSDLWGSGWVDLSTPRDVLTGDTLLIRVGGEAERVLVRLLPQGLPSDLAQWLVGGIHDLGPDRLVRLVAQGDYRDIVQISVHGGPSPWNRDLGEDNGSATIEELLITIQGRAAGGDHVGDILHSRGLPALVRRPVLPGRRH